MGKCNLAMEKPHKYKISEKFKEKLKGKRVVVLWIPDEYEYMQPELVELIKQKLPRVVQL
jgi:predicted protein tyrosine phosphatase